MPGCSSDRVSYTIRVDDVVLDGAGLISRSATAENIAYRLNYPVSVINLAADELMREQPLLNPFEAGITLCLINQSFAAEIRAIEESNSNPENEPNTESIADNPTTITLKLESVPSLWAMYSLDDLYRFLWVSEWGYDPVAYNYAEAEHRLIGEFTAQFVDTTGYGSTPPLPQQLPNIDARTQTMEADIYLQYLWMDVWRRPESYDFARAQELFILNYGMPVASLDYVTDVEGLSISPAVQVVLDHPFSDLLLGSNGIVDEARFGEIIHQYGMGAFLEYYNLVIGFGVFEPDLNISEYALAYAYLSAIENGEPPPFEAWFDPDLTTDNALYGAGTLLAYGENGNTDEAIATWMLGRAVSMLSLMPELAGVSPEEIEAQLAQMIPQGASSEQIVSMVNDIAYLVTQLHMANRNPDVDYRNAFRTAQELAGDSALFLQYRQIDEARQMIHEWDYEGAGNSLSLLRDKVTQIHALPALILGIPTIGVKIAFGNTLAQLEAWYSQMDEFRQQIPSIERETIFARALQDEELQAVQDLFWMSMGLTVGMIAEPLDWAISFGEYLATGDPSILLFAAIPLVPGVVARAARVVRGLPDVASTAWRFLGDLDYTSVTMGGLPRDLLKELLGDLGKHLDDVVQRMLNGDVVRPTMLPDATRTPRGTRAVLGGETGEEAQRLLNENIAADSLTRNYGFDVIQHPLQNRQLASDYDFNAFLQNRHPRTEPDLMINGVIFDVVTPISNNDSKAISAITAKGAQGDGAIVMLDALGLDWFTSRQSWIFSQLDSRTVQQIGRGDPAISQAIFMYNGEIVGIWSRS